MDENKLTAALIFLVPQTLDLIIEEYAVNEMEAAEIFYASELCKTLEDEKTKLWHLSAHALFELFREERETGRISYPEEA